MPFTICSVQEVPSYATIPLDHIISIHDHSQHGPDISGFKHPFTLHSFMFDDTGDSSNGRAPNESAISRLLGIYANVPLDNRVLFHCFAGVSRSTAAAFLWLVYHSVPYEQAYQAIVTTRGPFVCPNQLMIKIANHLMERNGEMASFLSAELGRREPARALGLKRIVKQFWR